MKKLMVAIVAVAAVAALATPSFAGVEFKYGGYFDVRAQYENNIMDGKNSNHGAADVLPNARNPRGIGGVIPGQSATFTGQISNDNNGVAVSSGVIGAAGGTWAPYRFDDKASWVDQRLRMYFSFVASERLQVVTKWEADTIWGMSGVATGTSVGRSGTGGYSWKQGGGGVGADEANLEMKNVYVDFLIPQTPLRATVGVQGIDLMKGWIFSDDASAAIVSGKFEPVSVTLGYAAGRNSNVFSTQDNIDDLIGVVSYAGGPFSASLTGFWEDAHRVPVNGSAAFFDANHNNGTQDQYYGANATQTITAVRAFNATTLNQFNQANLFAQGATTAGTVNAASGGAPLVVNTYSGVNSSVISTQTLHNNNLIDLGVSLGYKTDMINAYVNYVQNLGGADVVAGSTKVDSLDYKGYMFEGGVNFYIPSFTFTIGGFYTSGEDAKQYLEKSNGKMTSFDGFMYPTGASHYWSEIVGVGFFDARTNTIPDRRDAGGGWSGGDLPSNLWTISAGVAWQALPTTKLTANYYYIQTSNRALAGVNFTTNAAGTVTSESLDYDHDIGHELDLYLDQDIVDGLKLKLGAAYLWAGDAYSVYNGDDNVWQLGAALIWAF